MHSENGTNVSSSHEYALMRKLIVALLLLCGCFCTTYATASEYTLSDDAVVSLLTCSPGEELWSKYGHAAIRIRDARNNVDWVFNYGVFNFNTDHFYARFIKGETDYQLGLESMEWFVAGNAAIGRKTYEQVLNLTAAQKQDITDALLRNYRPENRFYRYNFVFDNCATRPYRLLDAALSESFRTPNFDNRKDTYRHLIEHYSGRYTWGAFGINLIFGKGADRLMTPAERLFLPEQLMDFVSEATFSNGDALCVLNEAQPFVIDNGSWWTSPQWVVILVVLLILGITYGDMRRNRISWWLDALLFLLYAILGIICCYLTFFSLHPLVGRNWNILFLSPIMFIPFALILFPKGRTWLLQSSLLVCLYFYIALLLRLCCGQQLHAFLWVIVAHLIHIRCCWYREVLVIGMPLRKKETTKGTAKKKLSSRSLLLFGCVLLSLPLCAASPRLTVVVCVDGLNQQCLDELRDYWQPGGIRTLNEEGHKAEVTFPQLVYGGAETLATLCTGQLPCTHGVSADTWFSRTDRKVHPIFEDNEAVGIGTDIRISPRNLLTPTITDEFRMRYPSARSKVYAVALHPEAAVVLAGHSANAVAWLDAKEQRWVSSGFYAEGLPSAADRMNVNGRIAQIAEREWVPRMDINTYMHPTEDEIRHKGFHYQSAKVLPNTPVANELVVELALALQEEQRLGTDIQPDMLLLQLTVVSPSATSDVLRSAEQEDMYLSLNQNLGFLMEQLTKRLGKDNFRMVLFGKPVHGQGIDVFDQAGLTVHRFNVDRAAALINTYLMAMYGHERWIDGGYLHSIYLNRTLIEQKKISLTELQRQVSGFLLEFEGVEAACPVTEVPLLQGEYGISLLRNTWNKRTFGDVVFSLQPLWLVGEDRAKSQTYMVERCPVVPFMLWTAGQVTLPPASLQATQVKQYILQ
ncbi:MAG: DUF4105 domain-containing protein [Bacteroides sp.]|nr:DUF4105 domain-containing protein [Bacteroides sp.]MCM1403067.1 DUF4105 domain-containing protein [Bacteroides sp.]MCM1576159.1 DUF4105 domain-containing protein [Bacteroides sp.]